MGRGRNRSIELNNDRAELNWKWGGLYSNVDSSWKEFSYKFQAVKENEIWKVAYLQGFDFDEITQKNGL